MVCDRCKMAVRTELDKLGLETIAVELGEVELKQEPDVKQKELLAKNLSAIGFELLDDKRLRTVNKIKSLIIELIYKSPEHLKIHLSDYLSNALNQDYSGLSKLFSEMENNTIERYLIQQKIERVKELLTYEEMNLSEIAFMLNYSSTAHLSKQFKDISGQTPSQFKSQQQKSRNTLDSF